MTTKYAKPQFNRTYISYVDFAEAEEYLKEFYPNVSRDASLNDNIKRALLIAAIIAYARPFSGNFNHQFATNAPPFDPKKVLGAQKAIDLHERILRLRNTALAHSQYDKKPVEEIRSIPNGFNVKAESFDILSEMIDPNYFRGLCICMKNYCVDKMHQLSDQASTE